MVAVATITQPSITAIEEAAAALSAQLVALDAATCTGEQARRLVVALARLERVSAAARLRAAARVDECGAHRAGGHRNTADFLAHQTGTAPHAAGAALDAAAELRRHASLNDALTNGELSEAQAVQIAPAVAANPAAVDDLLSVARTGSLRQLKDRARAVRLATIDAETLHRRQRRLREHHQWIDGEGMLAGRYRLPPEDGAIFAARINRETDRLYRAAPNDQRESTANYAADALMNLVTATDDGRSSNSGGESSRGKGRGKRGRSRVDAVVVIDLPALRRGHIHEGERCHIAGVGPIPVAVARRIAGDAFLKAVVIDGTDIVKVRHFGRHRPAELQTALDLGAAPELNGAECSRLGCGRRHGLQWDHIDPVANGGPTEYANLRPLCTPDHILKTEQDRAAGLLDPRRRRDRDPP